MTQKPGPRTLIDQAEREHGPGALQQIGTTNDDHVALVVVDDASSLHPSSVLAGEDYNESAAGIQARLLSQGLRKITAVAHKTGATVIFLNELQERTRLDAHQLNPGGNALKFYASLRLEVRHAPPVAVDRRDLVVVRVVKNKLAPPFREATFLRSQDGSLR